MKRLFSTLFSIFILTAIVIAQVEVLKNGDIIEMTKTGLSGDLIVLKIRQTEGDFDTTARDLIELKKAGVTDAVIAEMMKKAAENPPEETKPPPVNPGDVQKTHVVLDPVEALKNAKTIAIKKDSLQPSIQALEKELMKRRDWQNLNLNIVRYKEDADLLIEITFVNFSWITHRYSFRVYDNKSGTVIAAGETTSWGSLTENLAREISKKMTVALSRK